MNGIHSISIMSQKPFRRLVRRVREKGSVPKEERLFLFHCVIHEGLNGLEPFSTDFQPIVPMPATRLRKPSRHAMGESTSRIRAFPPLAALMGQVTQLLETLRQAFKAIKVTNQLGPPFLIESRSLLGVFGRWIVPCDSMAMGIMSSG